MVTHAIPPDFRGGVHSFKPSYAIGSVPSLSGHAIAYRWRSLPRVRRNRPSSPQGISSNGCCLCITMDQLMCVSLFPHPLYYYWYEMGMLKVSETYQVLTTVSRSPVAAANTSSKKTASCEQRKSTAHHHPVAFVEAPGS